MFRFVWDSASGTVRVYRNQQGRHRKKRVTPFDHLPTEDDGEVIELRSKDLDRRRALISSLDKLLDKVRVRYGEKGITVEDNLGGEKRVTELSVILEMMRGRNVVPTQVFSGRSRIDMIYKMGFNETSSRPIWVTQFMRAYTLFEFPTWRRVDQICMELCDKNFLSVTFTGLNPYSLLLNEMKFNELGQAFLPHDVVMSDVIAKAHKLADDPSVSMDRTYYGDPCSYDIESAYKKIFIKVQLWRGGGYKLVDFSQLDPLLKEAVEEPDVLSQLKLFPTLQELCIEKLYLTTIDQTRGSFADRYSLPHWIPIRGGMVPNHSLSPYVPLLRPDYYFHLGAFKTGASEEGIYKSLVKISKFDRLTVSAKAEHVIAAAMTMMKTFGFFERFRVYKNVDDLMNTIGAMSVPWDRNAGIHLCHAGEIDRKEYEFEGFTVEEIEMFTWDVDQKRNAMPGVSRMTRQQVEFLVEKLVEGIVKYDRKWFFLTIAKLGNKVEILGPEADRDKNRVFFIGCLMKMLLQKVTMSAPFREMFGKFFCGVGHCWSDAGVHRVAAQLKFSAFGRIPFRWFQGDFRSLDQSMKAGMLCFICMVMALTFDKGQTTDEKLMYRVCVAVMAFLADDTAITLIKWFGKEWRYVIGVLFSGEFVTSMFDTIYVYLALMVVHYTFIDDFKKCSGVDMADIKEKIFSAIENFCLIYGDDTTWCLPYEVVQLIESLPGVGVGRYMDEVIKRLKDLFDMEMKPKGSSDTDEFNTPFTKCTKDGILLQENGKYGLKFLRRHFVNTRFKVNDPALGYGYRDVETICAVRKISDVWAKATNTHHDANTYTQWHPRVKSFLYENMGVSLATDRFCRMFLLCIEKNMDYLDYKEDKDYIVLSERFNYARVKDDQDRTIKFDRGDKELIDKYKRNIPWITDEEIFSKLVPTRKWLLENLAYKLDNADFNLRLYSSRTLKEGVFRSDDDNFDW